MQAARAGREVVAVDQQVGAAARRDPRHVLLLDHLLGADAVGEDAGRVDDVVGLDLDALARLGLDEGDAGGAAVAVEHLGHLGAVQHHRAEALGLAEHRQDEAHVVGLAVVEEVGVVGVARLQRGHQLQHLVAVDRAVAVGRPVEVLVVLLGGAHLAAAAADPRRRHHVVHVEPDAESAVAALVAEGRGRGTASGRRGAAPAGPSAGARAAPRGPGRGRGSAGSAGRRGPSSRSGWRCRRRSRRAPAAPPSSRARRRRGRRRRR